MSRRVVFVVFPDLQLLDLTGPFEVLASANQLLLGRAGEPGYESEIVSRGGGVVRSSSGFPVTCHSSIRNCTGAIDTLVVVGGPGSQAASADADLIDWLKQASARSRRTVSVCTGAFVLAAAGILDGLRVTTHWASCARLAAKHPDVTVDPQPIFIRQGSVWTSAGVTAGMDLALGLVEEDLGADVARSVARWLVLFVQRPGGQSQFSVQLAAQVPERAALRELPRFIADNLAGDLSVPVLARRAGMSVRHFARAFRSEIGTTPAAYVEAARLEAAKRLLETSGDSFPAIVRTCGFGTLETMHRIFKRELGTTPGQYRQRFADRAS